jgi:hypothetical protein
MSLGAKINTGAARQFRQPAGLAGHVVGVMMNRRDLRTIASAVDALSRRSPPATRSPTPSD